MNPFKSGFISILGQPNVGKSTLLNSILEEKIAITSSKPQTTRTRILGIRNLENAQLIFYDTPGIHHGPRSKLHSLMVRTAIQTGKDADLALLLIEANHARIEGDESLLKNLQPTQTSIFLVINKIDLVSKPALLPLIEQYQRIYCFKEIIPLSALTGEGVNLLVELIQKYLPPGPRYFPRHISTNQTERFLASETIREKIFEETSEEIPYSVGVVVETFKEEREKNLLSISAVVFVDRPSQKGILIGKDGSMLRKIGTRARLDMESFFHTRVFLKLWVKVMKDWRENAGILKEMGYGVPGSSGVE